MRTEPRPFVTESATALAEKLRTGEASSRAIVDAHIAVLERENPRLHAVVEKRLDDARREADVADQALVAHREASARALREGSPRPAPLPPLTGIPCTIKESFGVAGMRVTGGLVARRDVVSPRDAVPLARLRAAGAIVLGTTNVSELCMWMESENKLYGTTNNPYDVTRGVGGSSGGEGASVAAGFAPFGLGADIGGSIRIPAFMCGVFGHKPTGGLIPNAGQFPAPAPSAMRVLTSGPLARRAEDLPLLVSILAGPTDESPETRPIPLGDPRAVSLEGLRVVDVAWNHLSPVDPVLRRAQRRLADHLASRGARVERLALPRLAKSVLVWGAVMSAAGGEPFAAMLGRGTPISVVRELGRSLLGRSNHTLPALALAAVEDLPKRFASDTSALEAEAASLRAELEERIGDGVMLFPSYTAPAPRHRAPWLRPVDWAYTALFNALEMPATAVPLGLAESGPHAGLPLGCQVAAPRGRDHVTLAVALEVERALGGWVPPSHLLDAR